MRIPWILLTCVICVTACPLVAVAETESARPTHFVFFLVDDLGWADLGCFGSTFYETPNIDRLCASGMKFTNGYAACPVCSPTRASIMTGRHPVRVDITDWIPGMSASRAKRAKLRHVEDRDNLALEEITIAEALKQHGYQTFFAGKWHLGGCEKGWSPGGYYAPWNNPNLKAENAGEYLTERLTDDTAVFFFSDNGGLSTLRRIGPTCNLPLRAGKGWLYEGGVREPLIIRARV